MTLVKLGLIVGILSGLVGIYQFIFDSNSSNVQTNITVNSSSNSNGNNAVSNSSNTVIINSN